MNQTPVQMLEALYAELPTVACKGLCWNSCGPIDMSDAEHQRIVELGVDIPRNNEERHRRWQNNEKGDLYCPALSFKARDGGIGCTVHEARPLICRLWGVGVGDMSCPHGCETTGTVDPQRMYDLLGRSFKIGGQGAHNVDAGMAVLNELVSNPQYADLVERLLAGDRSVEPEILTAIETIQGGQ